MLVCICKGVNDKKIRQLISQGATSVRAIMENCDAGKDCGACVCQLRELVSQATD